MGPTARTLKRLRENGWTCDVVERWLGGKIRKDLFGCIDVLAVKDGRLLAIQSTVGAAHANRVRKSANVKELREFLKVPNSRFEVWSWSKRGEHGKRKLWTLRTEGALSVMGD